MMRKRIAVAGLGAALLLLAFFGRHGSREKPDLGSSENAAAPRGKEAQTRKVEEAVATSHRRQSFGISISELLQDESVRNQFKLGSEEISEFLYRNQTNAMSLLIAFEATHDRDFLSRAAMAHPNDPIVQAKVLLYDLEPEKRSHWIERLKRSAPENSLPHIFAAKELMKAGDDAGALREIIAARDKRLEDYTREAWAGLEEAYLLAGRTPVAAKAVASTEILVPHLSPVKKLASELADRADEYGKSGDSAAQAALLQGAWIIGKQVHASGKRGVLLSDVVGLAIQNRSLQNWPESVAASFLGRSPSEQIAANDQEKKGIKAGTDFFRRWLPQAPENEVIAYLNRLRLHGEREAMEWLRKQHEPAP